VRLEGEVAIVTGGGRGIGEAIALGLAGEGASVVVTARTKSELDAAAERIRVLGRPALAVTCDVTLEEEVEQVVQRTLAEFGRVDVLVNNAGIGSLRPLRGIARASWDRVLAVNLTGSFLFTKHVWKAMAAGGGGAIVNVSSLAGRRGLPLQSAYCASKWGQIGLTLSAAEEGKAVGIRVNAVAPGPGRTAIRALIVEDKARMLAPEDHVGVCVFLASNEARFITGQVIEVEWFERGCRPGWAPALWRASANGPTPDLSASAAVSTGRGLERER
jgi:NAD(P)-dependent dehydrogenase (short-subunit alcohol dehydrogenase family)